MIGMGRRSGGYHSGKVTGLNRVDGRPAYAYFSVRILGTQSTGPHGAMLAAGGISTDRASLHGRCTVKSGFNAISFGLSQHLGRGVTQGGIFDVQRLYFFLFHIFFHIGLLGFHSPFMGHSFLRVDSKTVKKNILTNPIFWPKTVSP